MQQKASEPLGIILEVCDEIDFTRTVDDIFHHLESEVKELREELHRKNNNESPGDDGIPGEAVDIILCAMDIIYMNNPNITKEEIGAIIYKKLNKWVRVYGKENPTT